MNVRLGLREYIAQCADRPAPSLEEPDVTVLLVAWQSPERGVVDGVLPEDVLDVVIDHLIERGGRDRAVGLLREARAALAVP